MKEKHVLKRVWIITILISFVLVLLSQQSIADKQNLQHLKIKLPKPTYHSNTSIEQALLKRRSIRNYKEQPISLKEVSQLLWAAQGITDPKRGFRTTPSAGALYPLKVYVVANNVKNLTKGVYKYNPYKHELIKIKDKSVQNALTSAALWQPWVKKGAIVIVFSAVYTKTIQKYGNRGIRYVHMEVGHAAQNVYLQAVSLNLGTVVVGAFNDNKVKQILNMPKNEYPLYLMPVGKI